MEISERAVERFHQRYTHDPNTGCWVWSRGTDKNGYGKLTADRKCWQAHRFSYAIHFKRIQPKLLVCHHCDNPPCVNPEHLYQGTYQDNISDMFIRKRNADLRGEKSGHAKLKNEDVIDIRTNKSLSVLQLSEKYGVSRSAIYGIIHRISWKHI